MCENPDAEVSSALRPATERAVCHGADGAVWRRDSEFVTERRLYREEIHRLRKHFQAAEQQKKEAQQKNVRRQPTRLGDVCWISLTPRAAGRGGDEDSCGRQGGEKGCEGGAISCEPGDAPLSLPVGDEMRPDDSTGTQAASIEMQKGIVEAKQAVKRKK